MKKALAILLVLFPVCVNAQILGPKHHLELGAGLAMPGEVLFELAMKAQNTGTIYGEYRYNLTPDFALGAVYSFVIPHTSATTKETEIGSDGTTQTLPKLTYKDSFHTLNAIAEYRVGKSDSMGVYVGGGAGVQFYPGDWYPHRIGSGPYYPLSADLSLYFCFEFFKHLRLTVGHNHDIKYHFNPNTPIASYYYLSVGWSF